MKLKEICTEALKPSEYRQYVKGWDKSRWDAVFGGKYRIYLPLAPTDSSEVKPNPTIKRALAEIGMDIVDYVNGYAAKRGGTDSRTYRIGKILADPRFDFDPSLKKTFDHDPTRLNPKNALVVISRHPYDIAGMSTNRGWTSCLNLNSEESNAHYIPLEIKHGTCVAYLVRSDDKNIKHPIARVSIKPFVNIEDERDVALGVDEVTYGTTNKAFLQTVADWADGVNKSRKLRGVYMMSKDVYQTVGVPAKVIGIDDDQLKQQLQQVTADGKSIQEIDRPSEIVQLAAVKNDPYAIEYIDKPSETVQMAALKASSGGTETLMFPAWMRAGVFNLIKNPSPKVVAYAKFLGMID